MKNNIFSLRRFGLLLRRDLVQNWKLYALVLVVMFACVILFCFLPYMINIQPSRKSYPFEPNILSELSSNLWAIPGIAMFVLPLITFRFKDKGDTIFQLTTPASSLEKFVARYLLIIVGGMAMAFFAIFLADAATCAACTVLGWPFNKGWTMQFMFSTPYCYSSPVSSPLLDTWSNFLLNAVGITLTLIWQRHGLLKAFALIVACIVLDALLYQFTSLSVFRPLFITPFKMWCYWLFAIAATVLAYWLYAHKVVQRHRIF